MIVSLSLIPTVVAKTATAEPIPEWEKKGAKLPPASPAGEQTNGGQPAGEQTTVDPPADQMPPQPIHVRGSRR